MVSNSPHEDTVRSRQLADVWRTFADRLEAAGAPASLVAELRRLAEGAAGVFAPKDDASPDERLAVWVRLARPLAEWLRGAARRGADGRRQHWAKLRDDCRAHLGKPAAERSRGIWPFGRGGDAEGKDAIVGLLQRCHDALDALVKSGPPEGVEALLADLESATAAALPARWPPLVLARLAADLGPRGGELLARLEAPAAEPPDAGPARLLLMRRTVAAVAAIDGEETASALGRAVLDLMPGGGGDVPMPVPPQPPPVATTLPNRWALLPPPPAFDSDGGPTPAPLVRWHAQAARADATAAEKARAEFQTWLTAEGGDWLDRLARAAAEGTEPARAWLAALVEEKWCRCYPDALAEGSPAWPADAPFPGAADGEYAPARPGAVLRVARYAATPEAARVTLSQGPRGECPALDAADAALSVARAVGLDTLTAAIQRLLDTTRRARITGETPDAVPSLTEALDALVQATAARTSPGVSPTVLDDLLRALRDWGMAHGLEVLPRRWSFAAPPTRDQLAPEELTEATARFLTRDSRGTVSRVHAFGLARKSGEILRPCRVLLSAGPPPVGFAELEALVKTPAHPVEVKLQECLRGWREAVLGGTLEVVAVKLFVDFWGPLGEPLREAASERAQRFADQLAAVLAGELRLRTFIPKRYQDCPPGWLELVPGRGVVTGRVHRVLRPGLQDSEGRLRVPALVDVE